MMKRTYLLFALVAGGISMFCAGLPKYQAPGGSGAACGFAITVGLCVLASAVTKDKD